MLWPDLRRSRWLTDLTALVNSLFRSNTCAKSPPEHQARAGDVGEADFVAIRWAPVFARTVASHG